MNEHNDSIEGYVYILEVKDIVLPVCKIGMTSKDPHVRCSEINNNSTGDFIWQVAHHVAVSNCRALESLVHKHLEPLRQKHREFFNITADVAYEALQSILHNQSEITEIAIPESGNSPEAIARTERKRMKSTRVFGRRDSEYAEVLSLFASAMGVKGRPFGQLNKPMFGMSDGEEGVQWNIAVLTDMNEIRLGVNLEGKVYSGWPIATFILSELKHPHIENIKTELDQPESVFVQLLRDAWQVTSRPNIVEQYCGGNYFCVAEMTSEHWISILTEALGCLDEQRQYRGRNRQTVTPVDKVGRHGESITMPVSPHLTIWTPISLLGDISANVRNGIAKLRSVHEWVSEVSR